jgi:hypothetical protein
MVLYVYMVGAIRKSTFEYDFDYFWRGRLKFKNDFLVFRVKVSISYNKEVANLPLQK